MTTFLASANSRYYVGVRDNEIFFAREGAVVWEKQIPFDDFQVVAVGGNGQVFIHGPDGLYVYDANGREMHAPVARWSRETLASTSSQLTALRVSANGTRLCIERSTLQTGLSQKIFEFLSSNKVEPNTTIHEIFFHDLTDDTLKSFYRCLSPVRNQQQFLWNISRNFSWIVFAEPERKGALIRFSVANVETKTIYHEFAIPNIRIHALLIGRDGTALVDVSQNEGRAIIIVTLESEKRIITTPSLHYDVRHLGKDFAAIMMRTVPLLLIKNFDDQVVAQADLKPLQSLNMEYDVAFNDRDGIDLMSMTNNLFKVVHTNVDFLSTDARRWEHMAIARAVANLKPPEEPSRPKIRRPSKLEIDERRSPRDGTQASDDTGKDSAFPLGEDTKSMAAAVSDTVELIPRAKPLELSTLGTAGDDGPLKGGAPLKRARAKTATPAPSATAQPARKKPPSGDESTTLTDSERQRITRLMEVLDERFVLGEMSESTYLELKSKYKARLGIT